MRIAQEQRISTILPCCLSFIPVSVSFSFLKVFFFFLSFSYDWIELTSADASSGNLVLPEKKMGW
jgi:hypothetical protein